MPPSHDFSRKPAFGLREFCCILALLLLFALCFLWFVLSGDVLPEGTDPDRQSPISVEAFLGGYQAILDELNGTAPPVTEPEVLPPADPITFSLDEESSAFFCKDVTLTMSATDGRECTIYYTSDGSFPTPENGKRYDEALTLTADLMPVAYHFAAAAYYADGSVSALCCRTYFVGEWIDDYLTLPVFSVNVPEEELWSAERGIFHDNNLWGRGREWERQISLQLFESDGSRIFTMPAGMRLYGNYSRTMKQKPMRFYARPVYDEILDDFNSMTLFGTMYDSEGVRIDSFEDLVLRNAGNDFGTAFMRDEVVQTLMAQQGFVFTQPVRPCVVYVNGVMYGLYWLHEMYQESYFENRFDSYGFEGEFVVLDGPERAKLPDGKEHDGFDPLEDYKQMLKVGEELDMLDDDNYALLRSMMDVDSYLRLNATMAYVDNGDWPQNNNRVFKYFATEGEDFSDVYGMDGRWYFVPHDTDWAFFNDVNTLTLTRYYDPTPRDHNPYSPLFVNLMQREDCKETYITYLLDMMNGAYAPERMAQTIQDIADMITPALDLYIDQSPYVADNFDIAAFERRYGRIISYALARRDVMLNHLEQVYGLGSLYTLRVDIPDGAAVQINTMTCREAFSGTYCSIYPTRLQPVCPPGYEFVHWEVNGKIYTDEVFLARNAYNIQGVTTVTPVFRPSGELCIREVDFRNGCDVITLCNPCSVPVSTTGYSLSDHPDDPRKYSLPAITLQPGETLTIYCDNAPPELVLHALQTPFNLSRGETLSLYRALVPDQPPQSVHSVTLPKLKDGSRYRLDLTDGRFYEVLAGEK